jgi:nitrate/nitrite transporter NarK
MGRLHRDMTGNRRQLALATIAFLACFYAWSLLGPLGPDLQKELDLSEFELAFMVSVPVLLGSIMRIPLGILADRRGGRTTAKHPISHLRGHSGRRECPDAAGGPGQRPDRAMVAGGG